MPVRLSACRLILTKNCHYFPIRHWQIAFFSNGSTAFCITYEQSLYVLLIDFSFRKVNVKVRTFAAVVGSSSRVDGTIFLKWGSVCLYQAVDANVAYCCGTAVDGVLLSASGFCKKQCTVVDRGYEGSKYHCNILYLSRHSWHAKALGHVQFSNFVLAVWVFGLYN